MENPCAPGAHLRLWIVTSAGSATLPTSSTLLRSTVLTCAGISPYHGYRCLSDRSGAGIRCERSCEARREDETYVSLSPLRAHLQAQRALREA